MSYILEALKKLEQRREREETPRLLMLSPGHEQGRKKRLSWPYILAAVLLLNALVMMWWISGREGDKGGTSTGRAAPQRTAPWHPARRADRAPTGAEHSTAGTDRTAPGNDGAAKGTTRPEQTADRERAAPAPAARDAAQPLAGRVLEMGELPPAVRGALPEFRISGHAYSPEPQTRVARINEKILQEGQDLAPGLRLDEIVPDGVIFAFQGYRFRVGLNMGK